MNLQTSKPVIYFSEDVYNQFIFQTDRLCRAAEKVICEYQAIEAFPELDPATFFIDIKRNGDASFKRLYQKIADAEVVRMGIKLKSHLEAIKEASKNDLKGLSESIAELNRVETETRSNGGIVSYDELVIHENEVSVSKTRMEQVKNSFSYRCENEKEESIWENLELLKTIWDRLVFDLKKIGYPVSSSRPFFNPNTFHGVISEDRTDNTLFYKAEWFSFLIKFTREENRKNNPWLNGNN